MNGIETLLFGWIFFFLKKREWNPEAVLYGQAPDSAVNRNKGTFRGGPIWTGSNGLIWEQGKIIKIVKQGWRFSKKGRNQGRPYMDGPWNLKGLMLNQISKYGVDTESEKGKTEDHRATLPQTDLASSLTTHVCEVQVLKFWAETAWAKGVTEVDHPKRRQKFAKWVHWHNKLDRQWWGECQETM